METPKAEPEAEDTQEESRFRLTPEQLELITSQLRMGKPLPRYLLPYLFETAREYSLTYAGKSRRIDVLADTMSVPLQLTKRFPPEPIDQPKNMLVLGDNLQVLRRLIDLQADGDFRNPSGSRGMRLIYIDPPFATGQAWETRAGRVAYQDRARGAEFIEWLRQRLILLIELLAPDGSLVVHLDHRYAHYIKVVLDELLPGNFRNEIVVPRGIKGVQSQFEQIDALAQGHYSLLLYSKTASTRYPKLFDSGDKPARWDTFWLGTDRPTMRYELFGTTPTTGQWRWSEPKSQEAIKNHERYLADARGLNLEEFAEELAGGQGGIFPDFLRKGPNGQPQWYRYAKTRRLSSDVWDVKTKGSVTNFPTEKHEDLLERLITWLTNEGDLVLDAFVGSGTTVAVADRLSRRWIGIDFTKFAVYTTMARMLRQRDSGISNGEAFGLFAAALYDYQALKALEWTAYRAFVLQLFQCRDEPHTIGGVTLDGRLGEESVLVYNFQNEPAATIGDGFALDLARLCGEALGPRCFIVAPSVCVDLYEDYIDVGGVRFFFLRIPYSIIAELHKRAFVELRQPTSPQEANGVMESVGFDFIQPPRVETVKISTDSGTEVQILSFASEAFTAPETRPNLGDLAMVMVDAAYDGQIFDLDEVFYSEGLAARDWRFVVPPNDSGLPAMIVYVDVYGNELRELSRAQDLTRQAPTRAQGKKSR